MKRLLSIALTVMTMLLGLQAYAASDGTVHGTVVDKTGQPVIGAAVMIKGTTTGVTTDLDGAFSIKVAKGAVLVFNSLGYASKEVAWNGQSEIKVVLTDDVNYLDEVVVMGYGTQQKKLVTGATLQVKGEEISKLNNVDVLSSLRSLSPGVSITPNSGMPGDNFKVFIRGLGTTGSSSPLYVIDGVAGGDIQNLSQSDIESVDILKDAASSAIYGARAANGVILITTKQGKEGKPVVSYDMYYGVQNVVKLPTMLSPQQYMGIQNEINTISGSPTIDYSKAIPGIWAKLQDGSFTGTDWMRASLNKNAPTQSHAINVTGGTDRSKYSMGVSYVSQDGILGKQADPYYNRLTVRMNSDNVIIKNEDHDILQIGENVTFTYKNSHGIDIDDIYGNDIYNFLTASPLMPVYSSINDGYYEAADKAADGWSIEGTKFNPIAKMYYSSYNKNYSYNLLSNAYIELQPIKNLKIRSSFGYKLYASSWRSYTPIYNLCDYYKVTQNAVGQSMSLGHSWTLDNTISYNFVIAENNSFDIMIGQSVEKNSIGETVGGSNADLLFDGGLDYAWISNTTNTLTALKGVYGYPWTPSQLASFFGRINYSYKDKYLLSLIARADGSSNFAKGHRWGFFPSVSAGWVLTGEDWMKKASNIVSFLKLRASWGENGNCDIGALQYSSQISLFAPYTFGTDKSTYSTGAYQIQLSNEDITWETSRQFDAGIDARFFKSRLGITADFYDKRTIGLLVQAPGLDSWGTAPPMTNGGDILNRGFETSFTWDDTVGDFSYGVNANVSHNRNEVLAINNSEGIIHGASSVLVDGQSEIFRAEVGYPIGYFWGYKTAGVFQNTEQLAATSAKLSSATVGDLIFVDTNNDGAIDEQDKTMIGNPHPDVSLGFGGNMSWKGFDMSFSFYGALGLQVARNIRAYNTTDILQRWCGEGSSDRYPRLNNANQANWAYFSDINIEDADYLKLQNITIGYDFKHILKKVPIGQLRLYFSAQNLLTFTKYPGMDPEVGYSAGYSWGRGIDLGYYPASKVYMMGVNLKF